jgi:uncharacterized cupredoxin-like copper-binding protein
MAVSSVGMSEAIRFVVTNRSALDHHVRIDNTWAKQEQRKLMMTKPELHHRDPCAVSIKPRGGGDPNWARIQTGGFQLACLIPGRWIRPCMAR